jgi:putative ABC transport system ATP-binding protein
MNQDANPNPAADQADPVADQANPATEGANPVIVELVDCTKVYRQGQVEVPALRGLTLRVCRGEFTAISGPSGSGKTTALNLIGGLDQPTGGSVTLEGQSLGALSRTALSRLRRDRIGFVFQAYNLVPVLTAYENAEVVLSLQGVDAAQRREKVMALLNEVGLSGLEQRRPYELSGGQQQRVAIARAIAADPAVVLADEPTANLDSETADKLLSIMERLNRERGVTFLFSTHDPRVMERARRNLRLLDGRVSADETREG